MSAGLILDILILVLLGVTIVYAVRLSVYLRAVRDGRGEMQALVDTLAREVRNTETAVRGMKNMAENAGAALQDKINEAKFLSDEMRFMTEAGDSLAGRLERLADRNSALMSQIENAGGLASEIPAPAPRRSEPRPEKRPAPLARAPKLRPDSPEEEDLASFFIRDRDYEAGEEEDISEDGLFPGEEDNEPDFNSRAERELYEALRKRKPGRAGGAS